MSNGVLPPPSPASHVLEEPDGSLFPAAGGLGTLNLVINVASAADSIVPWGTSVVQRDQQLRQFWPTEHYFASALFSTIAQYVAFGWRLSGPPRTVRLSQQVLNNLQGGQGWEAMMTPFLIDYFTQDNGAFAEIVRIDNNDPASPVLSLNHLDAAKCQRTGRHEEPVVYTDAKGRNHLLKWWQVIHASEMPTPVEEGRGIQYSALTRVLRAAQILRDVHIVAQEKASGRFTRQVHLISGVQTSTIENAMAQKAAAAQAAGFVRYIQPLIVASLDPTARVTKETIDLASVPEDWDEEKSTRSYILLLSIAFGIDYQSLAPLPGGGLGSGSESKVLNMKSRGKGAALFMKKIERLFNFHGVLPRTVSFKFGEQDIAEQMELTSLRKERALAREIRIRSGEITTEVARQMAVDDGDLDPDYLKLMGEENITPYITTASTEDVSLHLPGVVTPGIPGPKEPPGTKPPEDLNDNNERVRAPSQNQKVNPGGTATERKRP